MHHGIPRCPHRYDALLIKRGRTSSLLGYLYFCKCKPLFNMLFTGDKDKNVVPLCRVSPWKPPQIAIGVKQVLPMRISPSTWQQVEESYCAMCGVATSAVWLAPHLLSLIEGGVPLGEGSRAAANERVAILLQTHPPGLDFVVKQGGIKKNHKSNGFRVGLQYCKRGIKLPFFFLLSPQSKH